MDRDKFKSPMTSKTTQLNRKQIYALMLSTMEEHKNTKHEHTRLLGILDAKYGAANLDELVEK